MRVYTVHAPKSIGSDGRILPDKVVFVRDGFYFWAFILGIVWLIWHRLWLGLIAYIVVTVAAEVALLAVGAPPVAGFLVFLVIALLLGLEAGSIRRWSLSRGKWRQLDLVAAPNAQAAEQRFFDRWVSTNDPRAARALPPMPRSSISSPDVVGFFPESGASR